MFVLYHNDGVLYMPSDYKKSCSEDIVSVLEKLQSKSVSSSQKNVCQNPINRSVNHCHFFLFLRRIIVQIIASMSIGKRNLVLTIDLKRMAQPPYTMEEFLSPFFRLDFLPVFCIVWIPQTEFFRRFFVQLKLKRTVYSCPAVRVNCTERSGLW